MKFGLIVTVSAATLIAVGRPDDVRAAPVENQGFLAAELFDQGWAAYEQQKYDDAMRLFRRAADGGSLPAMYQIGEMYELAQGAPEDMGQAMTWYRNAADHGMPKAQAAVGLLYGNGWGVPQNYSEALVWYLKAAEQGYSPAELSVGIAYTNGLGVAPDFAKARPWLGRAIEAGATDALDYLCPPYVANVAGALASKDAERLDRAIAEIDSHCSDLIGQAKAMRAAAIK